MRGSVTTPTDWRRNTIETDQGGAYERSSFDPRILPARPSRRRFLKGGAALSAALVAGAGVPLTGQTQPVPDDPSKVLGGPLRPYGERARFEESVRERPAGGLDTFGGNFSPLDETLGIITPSALHYVVQRGGTP